MNEICKQKYKLRISKINRDNLIIIPYKKLSDFVTTKNLVFHSQTPGKDL